MAGLLITGAVFITNTLQAQEVQQLLLNVEKLAELKNILDDLKKGYDVLLKGYTTIQNLSEGNFRLHEVFLDGLLEVSPAVRNYRRIPEIVEAQIRLVKGSREAFRQIAGSDLFSVEELRYIKAIFENLFSQSVGNIEALASVVTSGRLRLSDEERLGAIDDLWKDATDQLAFLRHFNGDTKLLALARARAAADVRVQKQLFSSSK